MPFVFLNVHMLNAKLWLDVCPMYEVFPHIPEYCQLKLQPKQFHAIFHTLSPSLPAPALLSKPSFRSNTQISNLCCGIHASLRTTLTSQINSIPPS